MNQADLQELERWFERYVAGFTTCEGTDDYVQRNLESRCEHIMRTREEMALLCEKLQLNAQRRLICDAIALLHDVGRFEQFVQYRTFNDHVSVNHGALGISILRREAILASFPAQEQYAIETAIAGHNLKQMPKDLSGDALLFTRLIRDADKIDILYCSVQYFQQYRQDPLSVDLELEFSDAPSCTPEVVAALLAGQQVPYERLETLHDLQLLQLGWVYDVNFEATFERLQQRGLLDQLLDFLPAGPDRTRVGWHVRAYVQSHLQRSLSLS
ncbi:MAG: HD domain-containing protein [Planctomycetes bacterium]|nr:HD domain-containing protein [Planctomycetota bacterium]